MTTVLLLIECNQFISFDRSLRIEQAEDNSDVVNKDNRRISE
ncbi:hypothetical protein CA13_28760 [Planctomycetes bacterium CA13]|uniref:Uncharacterized protein n=1 Tax=Novipirellula herctigrandis TaxID=2527986 RepID=A0A5C5Z4E8_9BACT|nr:hypothetical protein CA13_28760 [Planctomycetes bacterium CA13]